MIEVSKELQIFIEDTIELMEQDTKASWELIYTKLPTTSITGEFTELMLSIGMDPAEKLGYIPSYYLYNSKRKDYTIPDSITSIGGSAFYYCDSLTEIVIPNSVTGIGASVFSYCSDLIEINFKGTKKLAVLLGIGNRSRTKWRQDSYIKQIVCTDGVIEL